MITQLFDLIFLSLDIFVSLDDNMPMNRVQNSKKHRTYFNPGSQFVVARYFYNRNTKMGLHGHNYAEVCWIARGTCRHIIPNQEEKLVAGDIRFVRPQDVHCFKSIGSKPMHLTNVAFPEDILKTWERNYPCLNGRFFWSDSPLPDGVHLNEKQLEVMENQIDRLATRVHDLFYVHRFMLNLFAELMPPAPDTRHLPDWLKHGLAGLEDIETMQGGAAAFAQLCGRSPEHVARECRRLLDTTPTTLVNQARLTETARQLRMSNLDILNIMYECGFTNSSHFYSLFKQHYGVTPRDYRLGKTQ